ncbi:MAG: creatininase family protein [Planctomycetia bacterium]|nr:creatininase family protein [Planctomycetia bacterium]
MAEPAILLGKLTRREFRQRMQSGELRCCIIPVAAVEQHLEHLQMEHDWRSACHVAELVAARLRPHVVVAQGLMCGISEHHMQHIGTLSLRPGTFLAVLSDMLDSMVRAGFKNIVVLNGHGGNVAPCRGIWDQFVRQTHVNLHFLPYWEVLSEQDAIDLLKSGHRLPYDLPGHAQEFETSFAMSAFPENVRLDALRDQPDPNPGYATAETGAEFIRRIVDRVAQYVQDVMDGRRVMPIPPYHP